MLENYYLRTQREKKHVALSKIKGGYIKLNYTFMHTNVRVYICTHIHNTHIHKAL